MRKRPTDRSKGKSRTAARNLTDLLQPDRATSDELGRESDAGDAPAPGPRELPARAVHPEGKSSEPRPAKR